MKHASIKFCHYLYCSAFGTVGEDYMPVVIVGVYVHIMLNCTNAHDHVALWVKSVVLRRGTIKCVVNCWQMDSDLFQIML